MLTDKLNEFADNNVMFSHSNKMLTMQIIILHPLNFSMKRNSIDFIKYGLLLLILPSILVISCNKPQIQFGQAYINSSTSNIVLVDTLSASLSTVYLDSIPTSGSATVLAGYYNDPIFGKISASSFLELQPPPLSTLDPKSVYDSLVLIMRPNKSYYGDSTSFQQQLSVYQLISPINFPLYQNQFFNNSGFPVNPTPLGTTTTFIYPNYTDTVFIRLNDQLGDSLFNLFNAGDYSVQNTNSFISFFKGLKVTSGSMGMKAIYGFRDTVTMRLYYHVNGVFNTPKKLDFTYYNGDNKQFNQILSDRSGTPVSNFGGAYQVIPSETTNNSSFLQYITGFVPKIQFPTLRNLFLRPDFLKIIKAELIVTPVVQTYNPFSVLPPKLYAYPTDQTNYIGSPLLVAGTSVAQAGNFINDPIFNSNTSYTYDVTSYLQQQINIGYINQNGLLLIQPNPASISTFNRLVIGNQKNTGGTLQLKVYYVSSYL